MTATASRTLLCKGTPMQLGPLLGEGGEGRVHAIVGATDRVAKIYSAPVEADKAAKLKAMCALSTPALSKIAAWPHDLITSGGKIVGFTMPRVVGNRPIHMLYSPKTRAQEYPQATWAFLAHVALNTSRAFSVVHQHGHAIGDVNENNILVDDQGTVKLIDCDSFSVANYPCEVGVPIFTPPELQGKSLRGVVRTTDHDVFGLAVLNFLLLFMGRHPFAGRYLGQGEKPLEEMIAEQRFAYGSNAARLSVAQPPNTPLLQDVGGLARLFESAFAVGAAGKRPTAEQWAESFTTFKTRLRPCPRNRAHIRYGECPWCETEKSGIYYFKTVFILGKGNGSTLELTQAAVDELWKAINLVAAPGPGPQKPQRKGNPTAPSAPDVDLLLAEVERNRKPGRNVDHRRFLCLLLFFLILLYSALENPWAMFLSLVPMALYGEKQGAIFGRVRDLLKMKEAERARIREHWDEFDVLWSQRFEAVRTNPFQHKLDELTKIYQGLKNIHLERTQRVQALTKDQRRYQLASYLATVRIRNAPIDGLNQTQRTILLAQGIETAADLNYQALLKCQGFSRITAQRLLDWRAQLEKTFQPTDQVDPQTLARIEQELRDKFKAGVERLNQGLIDLQNVQQRTLAVHLALSTLITTQAAAVAREQGSLQADIRKLKDALR
jgi:DNA-binding helix-hairpin-helix protein with protein kinase domain